ncbi:MAG: phosphonate ABC transporter, permease protein PhnE [Deltaproteobacteria bacterium]|nr:phosphonate ABC transporter, permease protein PhnE [Deltaproteobacteria bacterium]
MKDRLIFQRSISFYFSFLVIASAVLWSLLSFDLPDRELNYFENGVRFLKRFFPPDFSIWRTVLESFLETLRIAILATLLAIIFSIPIAFCGSRLHRNAWLRYLIRFSLNAIRTIPSLIWALLAVALVGPHPLAGVIALSFYSLGYLGKFFIDALNAVDLNIARHLRATGAHNIQAFQYGIFASVKPVIVSHSLWMLEYNIRSASIIGYVGAGGLGTLLHQYQEYYQWNRFCTVLIVIFIVVLLLDAANEIYRKKHLVERT